MSSNDLGLVLLKGVNKLLGAMIKGLRAWRWTKFNIIALTTSTLAGAYFLHIPVVFSPMIYVIGLGWYENRGIATFEGFKIMGSKQVDDQVHYTIKTFVPYDKVVKEKSLIELKLNTDIVRFEESNKDKTIIILITKKGFKAKDPHLTCLAPYNPVPLKHHENDFYIIYKYKVDYINSNNIKVIKQHLKCKVVYSPPFIRFMYSKPDKILPLPQYVNEAKKGYLIGFDTETGKAVSWNWDTVPHVLVAGKTGSGKSVTAATLVQSSMYYDKSISCVMYDPKIVELVKYKNFDNVLYTRDKQDFEKLTRAILIEMKTRYEKMGEQGITDYQGSRLIVVVDEVAFIKNTLEKDEKDEISKQLLRIAQEGRAAKIHLVLFTQRPQVRQMDVNLREAIPGRIALYMSDNDGKTFMGVENASHIRKGFAKCYSDSHDVTYVRVPFTKENQFTELYNYLANTEVNLLKNDEYTFTPRKSKPAIQETFSVLDRLAKQSGMQYKPTKSIESKFWQLLREQGLIKNADMLAALGLEQTPRQLRSLKEEALRIGVLEKDGKTKYKLNLDKIPD